MLTTGPVAPACVCHQDKTCPEGPRLRWVEEGCCLCGVLSLLFSVFLSNESELSAILWQRLGTARAPTITPP